MTLDEGKIDKPYGILICQNIEPMLIKTLSDLMKYAKINAKGTSTNKNLLCMWLIIYLAKEVGEKLGRGKVLQRKMQTQQKIKA